MFDISMVVCYISVRSGEKYLQYEVEELSQCDRQRTLLNAASTTLLSESNDDIPFSVKYFESVREKQIVGVTLRRK